MFITTKGAGIVKRGEPYEAKYNDVYENVLTCDILQPIVLNLFFKYCDKFKTYNQYQQGVLVLEDNWVTKKGYFGQWTSFLDICITDLWLLREPKKQVRKVCILIFVP